jgi:PrtD family type I secretion system ABC transporter
MERSGCGREALSTRRPCTLRNWQVDWQQRGELETAVKLIGIELPEPLADALRQCRRHFAAAAIFSLLINILYLAPTLYMLQVYDRVVPTGGKTTLLFVTLALALALAALSGLDMVRNRLLVRASERVDALLAPRILEQMVANDTGQTAQAMRDFDSIRQTIGTPVIAAMFDAPWTPVFLLVAFLLHFWIGIMAVISAILLVTLAWSNQRATQARMELATTAIAASQNAQQAVAVQGTAVRGLGMTQAMVERQLDNRRVALASMVDAQMVGSKLTATSRFFRMFVQSAALGLGALLAIAGDISAGAIIASSILLSRALQPIESIIAGWSSLATARAALHRLEHVLEGLGAERTYTSLPAPKGLIEVEGVGVRGGDGRGILMGVNFRAAPGRITGIIGPNGSGKSTLGKVLVAAIQPTVGAVRLDGARLTDWDRSELGKHIGYMPQEPSLFEGTIKENISRFARPTTAEEAKAIDEAVIAAATEAGVHELILQLPQAYETRLGLMGSGLSLGQAQRIALARALYGDPTVLVLDEPNAFLDNAGEAALIGALTKARSRGATVIVIAHRRSVVDVADELLVLEEGRPKMMGPTSAVVRRLAGPQKPKAENAA